MPYKQAKGLMILLSKKSRRFRDLHSFDVLALHEFAKCEGKSETGDKI